MKFFNYLKHNLVVSFINLKDEEKHEFLSHRYDKTLFTYGQTKTDDQGLISFHTTPYNSVTNLRDILDHTCCRLAPMRNNLIKFEVSANFLHDLMSESPLILKNEKGSCILADKQHYYNVEVCKMAFLVLQMFPFWLRSNGISQEQMESAWLKTRIKYKFKGLIKFNNLFISSDILNVVKYRKYLKLLTVIHKLNYNDPDTQGPYKEVENKWEAEILNSNELNLNVNAFKPIKGHKVLPLNQIDALLFIFKDSVGSINAEIELNKLNDKINVAIKLSLADRFCELYNGEKLVDILIKLLNKANADQDKSFLNADKFSNLKALISGLDKLNTEDLLRYKVHQRMQIDLFVDKYGEKKYLIVKDVNTASLRDFNEGKSDVELLIDTVKLFNGHYYHASVDESLDNTLTSVADRATLLLNSQKLHKNNETFIGNKFTVTNRDVYNFVPIKIDKEFWVSGMNTVKRLTVVRKLIGTDLYLKDRELGNLELFKNTVNINYDKLTTFMNNLRVNRLAKLSVDDLIKIGQFGWSQDEGKLYYFLDRENNVFFLDLQGESYTNYTFGNSILNSCFRINADIMLGGDANLSSFDDILVKLESGLSFDNAQTILFLMEQKENSILEAAKVVGMHKKLQEEVEKKLVGELDKFKGPLNRVLQQRKFFSKDTVDTWFKHSNNLAILDKSTFTCLIKLLFITNNIKNEMQANNFLQNICNLDIKVEFRNNDILLMDKTGKAEVTIESRNIIEGQIVNMLCSRGYVTPDEVLLWPTFELDDTLRLLEIIQWYRLAICMEHALQNSSELAQKPNELTNILNNYTELCGMAFEADGLLIKISSDANIIAKERKQVFDMTKGLNLKKTILIGLKELFSLSDFVQKQVIPNLFESLLLDAQNIIGKDIITAINDYHRLINHSASLANLAIGLDFQLGEKPLEAKLLDAVRIVVTEAPEVFINKEEGSSLIDKLKNILPEGYVEDFMANYDELFRGRNRLIKELKRIGALSVIGLVDIYKSWAELVLVMNEKFNTMLLPVSKDKGIDDIIKVKVKDQITTAIMKQARW